MMADRGSHSTSKASRRRPKPQVSCMNCRAKKLKCDRAQPCKNCMKLAPGSCVYVSGAHMSEGSKHISSKQKRDDKRSDNLQERIKRIELAIASIAVQSTSTDNQKGSEKQSHDVLSRQHADLEVGDASPSLVTDEPEVHFVSPSHWESILKDIAVIKDELKLNETEMEDDPDDDSELQTSPQLLLGGARSVTREELILSMPSKSLFDALIASYMDESDMPWLLTILHIPTFVESCAKYWQNPEAVSLSWLSILFSLMSLSLQFIASTGKKVDGVFQPKALSGLYTSRAAQCLMASDYGKPTAYTIEAMFFYMASEHYWIEDGHFRGTLIFGLGVRLALRLGYHRDPSNFPHLSILESEMRRRVWYFMIALDLKLSHKCGLPCAMEYRCSDVKPPLNLLDEDLHASMQKMPDARPETEETGAGYAVYEATLLMLFNQVVDKINAPKPLSYEDTLDMEKEFMAEAVSKPSWFQAPLKDQNMKSSLHKLNRWIDADLVLQRARMIIHRRYLVPAHINTRYKQSRDVCLDAAEKVLRHQTVLYEASESYAGSTTSNWRFLSLSGHDFILAATLIYIDIDRTLKDRRAQPNQHLLWDGPVQQRLELLQSSEHVWTHFDKVGPGARKAAKLIKAMNKSLEQIWNPANQSLPAVRLPTEEPPIPLHGSVSTNHIIPILNNGQQAESDVQAYDTAQPIQSSTFPEWNSTDQFTGFDSVDNVFQGMFSDSLEHMDWATWDVEFQNNMPDIL